MDQIVELNVAEVEQIDGGLFPLVAAFAFGWGIGEGINYLMR